MIVHRYLAPVLLVAALAIGCGQSSGAGGKDRHTAAPPTAGAIVYSVDVDAFLLVYQEGLLVDDRGAVNLTETDHRSVQAIAPNGRLMVLGDYHGQGGGLYLRRRTRSGKTRTRLLTGEPDAPVAVCGADSAVYLDHTRLMQWDIGASEPRRIAAPLTPQRLACSASGRIAAITHDGRLMLGDASAGLRATGDGRYAEAAWSQADRLAACTAPGDEQPGRLVLIDDTGNETQSLAQIGEGCSLAWAPDGRHIAATSNTGRLTVVCTCAEPPRLLLAAEAWGDPTWSPDGTAIAYGNFVGLYAVTYPTARSVLIDDKQSYVVAWLDGHASRRARLLADPYPCCGP